MICAWKELLAIVPQNLREAVDGHRDTLQELRLRFGQEPELVTAGGSLWLSEKTSLQDLRFTVNAASRYSPWAADSARFGYITAPGGHRVGLCGEAVVRQGECDGIRELHSVNIRVARDFSGLADGAATRGNILILGPPGSGKTTLLRDLVRLIAATETVCVVDERGELFPEGFSRGKRMDVLTGCPKREGIGLLLRSMSPDVIAVDEITAREDCEALAEAIWCGVRLIATAHATSREDLLRRDIYRSVVQSGCFDTLLVLGGDKSWRKERMSR